MGGAARACEPGAPTPYGLVSNGQQALPLPPPPAFHRGSITAEEEWVDVRVLTCPLKEMGFTGRQMRRYKNGPQKTMWLPLCSEREPVIHAMNQGGMDLMCGL